MLLSERLLAGGGSAGGPITFIASSLTQSGSVGTINVATPAGAQAGDLLIGVMGVGEAAAANTWTGDTGWTELFDANNGNPNIRAAWILHDGSTASWNFTYAGTKKGGAVIMAFRNAAVDAVSGVVISSPVPSITLSSSSNLVLLCGADSSTGATMSATGFTSIIADSDATNPSIAVLSKSFGVAGSTGSMAYTDGAFSFDCAAIGLKQV